MKPIPYRRHRFQSPISQYSVWPYYRFPLSYREIECLLAERSVLECLPRGVSRCVQCHWWADLNFRLC